MAATLMVQNGCLPAIRVGRGWAIPWEALAAFAGDYLKGDSSQKLKNRTGGGKP